MYMSTVVVPYAAAAADGAGCWQQPLLLMLALAVAVRGICACAQANQ
jgi:hypothetical protein